MRSDYNKSKGGYTGTPTSLVKMKQIMIDGLKGTAKNLYNIMANPDVVSDRTFTNIDVAVSSLFDSAADRGEITTGDSSREDWWNNFTSWLRKTLFFWNKDSSRRLL
ncbi:hypothetical protein PHYSODRAFT_330698 [Phytophthora sojae]|uniref:Uncharacterized protein n=1 Tax=Phytophthora sojae (strain P6497) TaxID=1094619 RepID=G4ZFV0_PHYSP|nr:hypothetical protein PHYSODRAFT_330698 [Phytophthora sojae]EGZ16634.1 hypothetical protein PHYSODRAFT_330698 [Phytophthora sojae]|eukprot:XP_009525692.1 hypothetical protein PHYSODRAFT_330698 [Phytophthora sojae]